MNTTPKIFFSYFLVIVVLSFTVLCGSYLLISEQYQSQASERIKFAKENLFKLLKQVEANNSNLANMIANDSQIYSNLDDSKACLKILFDYLSKYSNAGCITLIDSQGNVIAQTDTPNKSKLNILSDSEVINNIISHGKDYHGYLSFGQTSMIFISSACPIIQDNNTLGAVIVSQPLNNEFLASCTTALEFFKINPERSIELIAYSLKNKSLIASTPNVLRKKFFLAKQLVDNSLNIDTLINKKNLKLLPNFPDIVGFDKDNMWWNIQVLNGENNSSAFGLLFIGIPITSANDYTVLIAIAIVVGIIICSILSLIIANQQSNSVNIPLRRLINYTQKLAKDLDETPRIKGLSGDWLVLVENIDTSVLYLRDTIKSLKQKSKNKEVIEPDSPINDKQVKGISDQLASLNKQFTIQSKQLSDAERNYNQANNNFMQLQKALDNLIMKVSDGVVFTDANNIIIKVNKQINIWTGLANNKLNGKPFNEFLQDIDPQNNTFYLKNYNQSEAKEVQITEVNYFLDANYNIKILCDLSLRNESSKLKQEFCSMLTSSIREGIIQAQANLDSLLLNPDIIASPILSNILDLNNSLFNLLALIDSLTMAYGGLIPGNSENYEQIVLTRLISECLEKTASLANQKNLSLDLKTSVGLPAISTNRNFLKFIMLTIIESFINLANNGSKIRIENIFKGNMILVLISCSEISMTNNEIANFFDGFNPKIHPHDKYIDYSKLYLVKYFAQRLGLNLNLEPRADINGLCATININL